MGSDDDGDDSGCGDDEGNNSDCTCGDDERRIIDFLNHVHTYDPGGGGRDEEKYGFKQEVDVSG